MQIAGRLGIRVQDVENVIIWGNHSSTQYPDVNHGTVNLPDGQLPIRQAVKDDNWLNGDFVKVRQCSVTCSVVLIVLLLMYLIVCFFFIHDSGFHLGVLHIRFDLALACCMYTIS